jgi:hypothetical protein
MSPRPDISLSRRAAEEFLAAQDRVVLVASTGDDAPLARTARARFEGGVIVVSLPEHDPLIEALAVDARACCIAEQFPSYYEIKSVIVHGTAWCTGPARDGEVSYIIALEQLTTFDFARLRGT